MRPRWVTPVLASVAGAAIVVAAVWIAAGHRAPDTAAAEAPPPAATSATPVPAAPPYRAPSPDALAALPEAVYDAVIPGLMGFAADTVPDAARTAYHLAADAPLYGADRTTPVARLAQHDFLGEPTVVLPVESDGEWTLVLTPARQTLPSQSGGAAPAQSAGWVRTSLLTDPQPLKGYVSISVSQQTLSIIDGGTTLGSFAVGVGTVDTATPTGVVGYLEARYLDPAQDQTVYPIQLTSLHSAAADEPYAGSDGGLIGLHFQEDSTGAVSHGCVRLGADAVIAVNALPLGTPVLITP